MTDWQQVLRAVQQRVLYKSICAGCGKQRLSPVFVSTPQFCNRECHDAWEAASGAHLD